MSEKEISFDKIHEDYCDFIDSCGKFNCYTRSKELQDEKSKECIQYLLIIKSYKHQAIQNKSEHIANQFFHMQCMINATKSFLLMWVNLKDGEFNKSWSHLVDAQRYRA